MKEMVQNAVQIQNNRYKDINIRYNCQLSGSQLRKFCMTDSAGDELLQKAYENFHLSARGYAKLLRVARTIADLEHSERIHVSHISEAVCFRNIRFWMTE